MDKPLASFACRNVLCPGRPHGHGEKELAVQAEVVRASGPLFGGGELLAANLRVAHQVTTQRVPENFRGDLVVCREGFVRQFGQCILRQTRVTSQIRQPRQFQIQRMHGM